MFCGLSLSPSVAVTCCAEKDVSCQKKGGLEKGVGFSSMPQAEIEGLQQAETGGISNHLLLPSPEDLWIPYGNKNKYYFTRIDQLVFF